MAFTRRTDNRITEFNKIRSEIVGLSKSPLYKYRTENKYFPVMGEGNIDAHIMFIGEAPGETEAKTGKPFCGRSGKLLDELLTSIGMDRAKVYITNLVKDRPQDNRDPSPDEIALYASFLDRQIEIIQPCVIATLGRHSMKYVFERYGVTEGMLDVAVQNKKPKIAPVSEIHGRAFTGKASYGTVTVVALYHPAAALYNGSMKPVLIDDFKILKKYI